MQDEPALTFLVGRADLHAQAEVASERALQVLEVGGGGGLCLFRLGGGHGGDVLDDPLEVAHRQVLLNHELGETVLFRGLDDPGEELGVAES